MLQMMASLTEREREFVTSTTTAAMITVADGVAKPARVAIGMLDGVVLSSGTADRVRTLRLRMDPRCTLFLFVGDWQWLALETTVILHEGEEAMALQVPLLRQIQGRPTGPLSWFDGDIDEADLLDSMRSENRLLYEFQVHRSYGMI
jgi:hypothetical protein